MEHHHHLRRHNNHRQNTNSIEIFSFPSTPRSQDQDSDFEFGSFTPDSPTTDPYKNSPADHLFYNGKLLPHSFPLQLQQPPFTAVAIAEKIYRTTSRASSCKDSLMSSRSNSVNSSRSSISCSSARTSSSENSERRLFYHNTKLAYKRSSSASSSSSSSTFMASKVVMAQLYGSSQRWQHIVPLPNNLKREDSQRKMNAILVKNGSICYKKEDLNLEGKKGKASRLWLRFFKSFWVGCKQCHAMEPSTNDDILQPSMKR